MAARFLVISFQRSGLNWLRYCTEYFSGKRTPGRKQLIAEGPVLFDRAHDVRRPPLRSDYRRLRDESGAEVYERVALLLRHPFDCFTSHYLGRADVNFRKGLEQFNAYANNINEFDRLNGTKAVFYFDDFVNNESGTLAFLRFFDVDTSRRSYDFAEMIQASRGWYRGHHGLLMERERPQLKAKERAAICRMLKEDLGDKFERYLGRYSLE
ncbi:MAG: hypothetical protein DLM52_12355 [Chthoniobacterales bacterium]|nr:MAG: hypothetical protein DLM52_12355 [Chthoniobacterales bacterium]